jgi:chaperonin GroEL
MSKKIRLGIEPLQLIKEGVNTLANAVKVTLGPRGRTVILYRGFGGPHVTKDGVTVAKDVEFENSVMEMASTLVKQVAKKTADEGGDGTSTSITLIDAMFSLAYDKLVSKPKLFGLIPSKFTDVNPMELKQGMEMAVTDVIKSLKKITYKIQNSKELKNIAMISSNGDESMGNALYGIYSKLGNSVRITRDPDPSISGKDEVTISEGYKLDRGYASPSFTNFKDRTVCKLESPIFGLFSGTLNSFDILIPFLELSFLIKRPLVIVADDFDSKILESLVKNNLNSKTPDILALKTPGMGDKKSYNLEDLAAVIGYNLPFVNPDEKLVKETNLGSCKRLLSTHSETTIVVSESNSDLLQEHLKFLESSITEDLSDYAIDIQKERISRLKGKVAVISLHAKTEGELLERIDRLDDAIEATKSAIEEGYIAGSGLPLYRISEKLNKDLMSKISIISRSSILGYLCVLEAIKEPFNNILSNGGIDPDKVYKKIPKQINQELVPENKHYTLGYNSRTDTYGDLILQGIIDPVKVTRIALENAVSTSGVLLTTGCTISLN